MIASHSAVKLTFVLRIELCRVLRMSAYTISASMSMMMMRVAGTVSGGEV